MEDEIKQFKSTAWQRPAMAYNYRKTVNEAPGYQDFLADIFLAPLIEKFSSRDTQILDLGCGTGILIERLARLGYRVDGADISKEMLMQIDRTHFGDRCRLYQADIFNLSALHQSRYDAIVSRWVLPHFYDWPKILDSVYSVLKPNGIFYFDMTSTENYEYAEEHFHFNYDHFSYDNRTDKAKRENFYASVNTQELNSLVKAHGFYLLDASPLSLFYANPIFSTDSLGLNTNNKVKDMIESLVQTEAGKAFFSYFEKNITPRLPNQCSNLLCVAVQKREV